GAERHRRLVLVEKDGLLEKLQQHFVEPAQLHDRAVIALHELLDGKREARVLVAEHLRKLDLMVEQQPIFAPTREQVQTEADTPKERAALREDSQLTFREEIVIHEIGEALRAEMAAREPRDHLNV